MQKIILVDTNSSLISVKYIADKLEHQYDLTVAERFSSNIDITPNLYLDFQEVVLAYKNNAIFSCITDPSNYTVGITMDEFYNSNIIYLSISELLNVPDHKLTNCLIIWVDSDKDNCTTDDISVSQNMENIVNTCEHMYFLPNELDIAVDIIWEFINSTVEEKQNILKENS